MKTKKMELTTEEAIKLGESQWWVGKTSREIAEFQLFTTALCCPFDVFHKAMEESLGRPIWTHEFGLDYDGLCKEFLGDRPTPTFAEILNLIPADKRIIVAVKHANDR